MEPAFDLEEKVRAIVANLGSFEQVERIGWGGMGVVFRARSRDGSDLAVKVLRPNARDDVVARFAREARLLATLGAEQGFVPFLRFSEEPWPHIVMPFLGGG